MIVNDYAVLHPVVENWVTKLNQIGYKVNIFNPSNKNQVGNFAHFIKNNKFFSQLLRVANLSNFFRLFIIIKKSKPDLVWFHHINNSVSWICLTVPVKQNQTKIMTMHELSSLYTYKITKGMLGPNLVFKYSQLGFVQSLYYRIRNRLIRTFLSQVKVVSIGNLNNKILQSNGVKIAKRIENYVPDCVCKISNLSQKENNVLFAGRIAFKGLDKLINCIKLQKEWKLFLAGGEELVDYASNELPKERYVYLGEMKNVDLVKRIHEMKFVSVLSECYDNFPTIGIEALIHDSFPITTEITGLAEMCQNIDSRLVIKVDDILDLNYLDSIFYSRNQVFNHSKPIFADFETFLEEYFSLLESNPD